MPIRLQPEFQPLNPMPPHSRQVVSCSRKCTGSRSAKSLSLSKPRWQVEATRNLWRRRAALATGSASLPTAEAALERVALRVSSGGHHIPEDVVRRRFERGLSNFFHLYQPLADRWLFSDNGGRRTNLLAHGGVGRATVEKSFVYAHLKEQYGPR